MNGDVRPDANGLNVFAQWFHSSYDPKQMSLDSGAFASIGLTNEHKFLEVYLDVEEAREKAHEIDVAGATAKLDNLVQGLRTFTFTSCRVFVGLLHSYLHTNMVKLVMPQQVLGVFKRVHTLPCMARGRWLMGLQRKHFCDTAKDHPPRTHPKHCIHPFVDVQYLHCHRVFERPSHSCLTTVIGIPVRSN